MLRIDVTLACVLAATVAGCAGSPDTAPPSATADRQAATTFAEAVATASAELPDGVPYEVEMERLDGKDVIEVEFLVGATVREVYIDPNTGEVLTVRDEAPDHTEQSAEELETQAGMMSSATITLTDAETIAADHTGGDVREVEFKVVDGQLVAEVAVATQEGTTKVLVDAVSGDVLDANAPTSDDEGPTE